MLHGSVNPEIFVVGWMDCGIGFKGTFSGKLTSLKVIDICQIFGEDAEHAHGLIIKKKRRKGLTLLSSFQRLFSNNFVLMFSCFLDFSLLW